MVIAIVLLGALEADYRLHGQRPYVADSPSVLALVARQAREAGPDAIVIAGSSRALLDIDAPTLSAAYGGRPVFQLAQSGTSCMPVLEELVKESSFAGTIVCGTEPTSLFGIHERDRERTGEPRLRLPVERWDVRIASRARMFLEERVSVLGRDPRTYFRRIAGGAEWPPPPRPARTSDRVSRASLEGGAIDTAAADERIAGLFETGGGRATTPEELAATVGYLNELVRRFAARGGRVVWVELPSNGRTRAVEERRYPRATYWDWFATHIAPAGSAMTVRDSPELNAFKCPDGSHLDASSAVPFTQRLAPALNLSR